MLLPFSICFICCCTKRKYAFNFNHIRHLFEMINTLLATFLGWKICLYGLCQGFCKLCHSSVEIHIVDCLLLDISGPLQHSSVRQNNALSFCSLLWRLLRMLFRFLSYKSSEAGYTGFHCYRVLNFTNPQRVSSKFLPFIFSLFNSTFPVSKYIGWNLFGNTCTVLLLLSLTYLRCFWPWKIQLFFLLMRFFRQQQL